MRKHITHTVQGQYKIKSGFDPYTFGSSMPGLSYLHQDAETGLYDSAEGGYRFGFNGKESFSETESMLWVFEMRTFHPSLCKFMSVDPRQIEYPWQSAYQYYLNSPIAQVDILGMGGPYQEIEDGATGVEPTKPPFNRQINIVYSNLEGRSGSLIIIINDAYRKTSKNLEDANKGMWDYIQCNNIAEAITILDQDPFYKKSGSINHLVIRSHGTIVGTDDNKHTILTSNGGVPLDDPSNSEVVALNTLAAKLSNSANIVLSGCAIVRCDVDQKSGEITNAKGATYAAKHLNQIFTRNTDRSLFLDFTTTCVQIPLQYEKESKSWIWGITYNKPILCSQWAGFIKYKWSSTNNYHYRAEREYLDMQLNNTLGNIEIIKLNIVNAYDR